MSSRRGGAEEAPREGSGKLSPADLARVITPHLGASRPEVLLGPRVGADSGIVRVGAGRVIAVTTDPLSIVPALGAAESAWLACHLVASDLWTSGIPPAYAAITLNLPPALPEATLAEFWQAMSDEWRRLEVAVVTGHTGHYAGCDLTIVGACTLIGVGDEGRTVGPDFVKPGDRLILTRGCAIEATAVAARLFPERLAERLDPEGLARARALLPQVSVVASCRAALRAGVRDRGVTALHDATEGGVLGALLELARGCGHDFRVDRARIPLSAEASAACEVFGIDPYWTLSQGSLLIAARPDRAPAVIEALAEEATPAADVGEVMRGSGILWLTEPDGRVLRLTEPLPDPYWPAYERAVREGWK
jgi:hydrogenase maturation factor